MASYQSSIKRKPENLIKVYDDVFEPELCNEFIKFFENNKDKTFLEDSEPRSFTELNLNDYPEFSNIQAQVIGQLRPYVKKYQTENQIKDTNWPNNYRFESLRFKKYEANDIDRFEEHIDHSATNSTRFLVLFVYLNDTDGATSFPELDISIKPKIGRLLMFPPFWMYPHIGEKPKQNKKYIIGTYCHYV